MSEVVTYEGRDRVAYLTLNRPERLNALDDHMPGAIRAAVERADHDDGVRVVVLPASVPNAPSACCSP